MIGADERYLLTDNGTFFSTGSHTVETLLPIYHLDKAGFAFGVATVSGNPVKFESWAMPSEDVEVQGSFARYHPRFKQPLALSTVIAQGLGNYAVIFIPGGHGALINIPRSRDVGAVLKWAAANNKFVISLCHGPAAFFAVGHSDIYRSYKICAFPDVLDAMTPDIGHMPGHLTWKFGEKLQCFTGILSGWGSHTLTS